MPFRIGAAPGQAGTDSPGVQTFWATLLLGTIGALDWWITSEISVSTLYLIPVGWMSWVWGKKGAIATSLVAAVVWYLAEDVGRLHSAHMREPFWQALSRFFFYVITGLLVDRIRVLTSSLEALVQRRTAALEAEVAHRSELERAAAEITNREQQRIAHELHDELGAFLAGIAFRVKALAEVLDRRDAPEMADARSLVGLVNGANDQVRGLAHSLAPLGGWDRALGEVLSQLGREVETTFGITCAVEVPATVPGLTAEHTSELFRIAREAIRNAVKHSKAREVEVSVCVQDGHLQLKIACDGERWQAAAEPTPGLGLRIMRHRTKRLEGTLAIKPLETGGALVCCTIPVIRLKTPSAVSFNRLSTAS